MRPVTESGTHASMARSPRSHLDILSAEEAPSVEAVAVEGEAHPLRARATPHRLDSVGGHHGDLHDPSRCRPLGVPTSGLVFPALRGDNAGTGEKTGVSHASGLRRDFKRPLGLEVPMLRENTSQARAIPAQALPAIRVTTVNPANETFAPSGAESRRLAAGAERDSQPNSASKGGGPTGTRTQDQWIKNPLL